MDKSAKTLYDSDKSLIFKDIARTAQKTGNASGDEKSGLSLPSLDNGVDNSAQALYDKHKSLICKRVACAAQKMGRLGPLVPGYPCLRWTIVWITLHKPCMTAPSR